MRQSLMVFDEASAARGIEDVLVGLGYRVSARVSSVSDALRHLGAAPVDAAIMDVRVGDHWSYEIADELAERDIPFLLSSFDGRDTLPPRFRDRPLIQKPLKVPDLVVAVTRLTGLLEPGSPPAPRSASPPPIRSYSSAVLERAETQIGEAKARIARIEALLGHRSTAEGDRLLVELRKLLGTMTHYREQVRHAAGRRR